MDPEREKKVREKYLEEERGNIMRAGLIREQVYSLLIGKGFYEEEIEVDPSLTVSDGKRTEECCVDFLLKPGGRGFAALICSPAALESSERHALAWGRLAGAMYCIVTNGAGARVLKTDTGELLGDKLLDIPERNQAIFLLKDFTPAEYPEDRFLKERRILLAFNVTRCDFKDICPSGE